MQSRSSLESVLFIPICLFLNLLFIACSPTKPSQTDEKKPNTYLKGEMPLQHGMTLFNQHCASCHNFSENGIGPNLSGVTTEVEKDWLVKFIHNPQTIIESGDARAVALFEKYRQYMPPFPMLEGEDIESILAFIHKFSQGEKRSKNNRPGGLLNPIPKKVPSSNLTLILEEQFRIPASSEAPPLTRINKMEAIRNGRVFLHDLRGKLYEILQGTAPKVYLNLPDSLANFIDNPGKGTGFGSWAFHPDYAENGLFYTSHNEPPNTASADFPLPDTINTTIQAVITEWKADDPKGSTFSGTRREILRADLFGSAHGFQELAFNPLTKKGDPDHGLLYVGIGDASTALGGYPFLCNSPSQIWGSVIRIDPQARNGRNGKYGIPSNNPFVGEIDKLEEIYAYGFRNPHRISWDETGSGSMFITNIGQHSIEEINIGKAGANYGWPFREGNFLFDVDANPELVYPLPSEDGDFTYPVVQYDHDEGSAVSGGYVYKGSKILSLKGKYIFGDISLGTVFYSELNEMKEGQSAKLFRLHIAMKGGQKSDLARITGRKRVELRMGMDHAGELYILTKANGGVYKIVDCVENFQEAQSAG